MSGIQVENLKIISKEFIFVFGFILYPYTIGRLSVSLILWTVLLLFLLVKQRFTFGSINKWFLFFLIYIVFHEIVVLLFSTDSFIIINNMLNAILVFFIVVVCSQCFDMNKLKKSLYVFGVLTSIAIIYQTIRILVLKQPVSTLILFPFLADLENARWTTLSYRAMGIFHEPQTYATFIIPMVLIALHEKKYILASFFTICVLMSGSTLGVIVIAALWVYEVFNSSLALRWKGLILLLIGLGLYAFATFDIFDSALNKLISTDASTNSRISQGYYIIKQMPWPDTIVGIGKISLEEYIVNHNMFLPKMIDATSSGKWTYVTSLYEILIRYGFLGVVLFSGFIISMVRRTSFIIRKMTFVVLLLSFSQTLLFNVDFAYIYVILFTLFFAYDNELSETKNITLTWGNQN